MEGGRDGERQEDIGEKGGWEVKMTEDVKKEAKRGKGVKGQGSLMKVPCCFLSCSSWCPEQC